MKKQAMTASLMSLALLVSPLGSLRFIPRVSAAEDQGIAMGSVSDNASVSGNVTQKTALDTPVNLRWGEESDTLSNGKYRILWDGVNESVGEDGYVMWDWELCRDGQYIEYGGLKDPHNEMHWDDEKGQWVIDPVIIEQHADKVSELINESGAYKFRVRARAEYGDKSYSDGEWSEWSETITYTRPERALEDAYGYWDAQEAGVFHVVPSADFQNIEYYKLELYGSWDDENWVSCTGRWYDPNSTGIKVDFSSDIDRKGAGKYCVSVQAYSSDIDVVANGKEGPKSDILDTRVNADKLSGILNSAAGQGAADTVALLKDSAEISAIQQAMQTSDAFREQVKELEARYAAEQDIALEPATVSETAKEYVESGKVSVVGAAFNAAQGTAVGLQMDVTPQANRVPVYSGFGKNVQLDVRLACDGKEVHELAMPVSVTMPVPKGISLARLVILHYHADGTIEKTAFHENGDGTITFTVTGFSTFLFAEESVEDEPDPDPVPGEDDSVSGGDKPAPGQNGGGSTGQPYFLAALESRIAAAAPGTTVKVTKEQNINTLSNATMQMLVKRGDVALEMEYVYEGQEYHIVIPAGLAVDNDIAWYGPLYLSAYYSAADAGEVSVFAYIVKKGDTLGKIARSYNTTVAQLMAANPQIKNANRIMAGQIINIQ